LAKHKRSFVLIPVDHIGAPATLVLPGESPVGPALTLVSGASLTARPEGPA
jgi:hypothetical protein